MSTQENSSVYLNVKIEQSKFFSKEMLSPDQLQVKIMVENNQKEKIKVTNVSY
jgi:hypothetical protein